jgi:hypothetical protein
MKFNHTVEIPAHQPAAARTHIWNAFGRHFDFDIATSHMNVRRRFCSRLRRASMNSYGLWIQIGIKLPVAEVDLVPGDDRRHLPDCLRGRSDIAIAMTRACRATPEPSAKIRHS